MDHSRSIVIACATVIEEMLPLLPQGMAYRVFDFGLHVKPDQLHEMLQTTIDALDGEYETVVLGYGLCSRAVIGIHAASSRLVLPRVDDCIGLFLGSRSAYLEQNQKEPGTYYMTKGWIEAGDSPFAEYDRMVEQYGADRARTVYQIMMGNYRRLALINTGQQGMDRYREYIRQLAERFGLRYEEIEGSSVLLLKMIFGPWDDDFIVIEPGDSIQFEHFYP